MDDHGTPGLDLVVLGTHFRVLTRRAATRDALAQQWSRCLAPSDAEAIETDAGDTGDFLERDGYGLASQLTLQAIERAMGERLMFHAAGLATRQGDVVALVAPSGTGKTTAARTLCADAFGYVTDETVSVGIGAEPDVLPYPKPLSVVTEQNGRKAQHGPDELGLAPTPSHLRLTRLVLLDRHEEPTVPSLSPVDLLDGLLEASQQISALSALPDPLQVLCRTVDRCHGVVRLSYSDIAETTDLLTDLAATPPVRAAENWQPWRPQGRPDHWTDAVRIGEEVLVLVGTVPVRLGPIGWTALEVLLRGGDEAEVLSEATERYGEHPAAASLVADAIAAIRAGGLLPLP
ncbi:hypothetical protein GA0111570_101351 [Raineyella antarctica]|uniref:Uncharacterized protein n=1 Tax=Raineyella antarctica TaxID=1577474 RepID=A0A1G6GFX0_9ACTN|nr:hypothetical protein [Raineyella antarctica]SDB80076.1 hypothetical protein GA0111570_101351 [Raineyella antarctica]